MNAKDYLALREAIRKQEMVTVQYNKPGRGVVTRHVRPYEDSVNRSGSPVVWGTDSIHGPRQIHSFRQDRIVGVKESKKPKEFNRAKSIDKHLVTGNPDKADEFDPNGG
jgi:predicted DNA-binding transcriptional regulator YafY